MERNWTYRDEVGSEYGPYSREELERYAGEGRVSAGGSIKGPEGDWTTVEEAGLVIPKIDPNHPTTDQAAAMHQVRAEASLEGMIANGTRTRTTVGALADRRKCHGKCERFVQLTDEVLAAANAFYREDFERFGFSRAATARDIAVDVLEFHPAGKRYPQVRHTIHHDDWGRRAWCHGAV